MSKKTIWLIISLMSIALIGLIGFQLYWINNAISLRNDRFEKDVQESLRNVAQKIEKNEMLFFVSKNELWEFNKRTSTPGEVHEVEDVSPDSSVKNVFKFKSNQNKVELIYTEGVVEDTMRKEVHIVQQSAVASNEQSCLYHPHSDVPPTRRSR